MQIKDYYDMLQIPFEASDREIENSYKKFIQQYHPDLNNYSKEECEVEFKKILEAYEILKDNKKRKEYDVVYKKVIRNNYKQSKLDNKKYSSKIYRELFVLEVSIENLKDLRNKYLIKIGINLGICILGAILTLISYESAGYNERYTVFSGAIFIGGFLALANMWQWIEISFKIMKIQKLLRKYNI